MSFATPQEEDQERVRQMHDYNNMGSGKPISTNWQRTPHSKTEGGMTLYQWMCQFCGTDTWMPWGQFEEHHCVELERLFTESDPDS